ncbi:MULTISPECIES: EscU/YscU/HrcU family type III secretion system export apparatus switch protein [Bradyrhizobium]|uniref:EscU/YscU/HrcU family type III secretion system export apparatus switch protein n=4 Tax=Bradyrhizobium TaxID=374 RepID=A0A974ABF5_9BRAD|nr:MULTISPECIES: EscU/YscU/HrcU family type III secretion system export apparatus switch protein [Bradyrhizobium]UFX44334.1 EscU/YscU/HrcU family type III secretion system export apparatus switch protein [Bradyrhizobium sp. 41S5]UGA42039.1 EscU/YscU/HrcU family type III secretion system export apparatus switch protein [Bradyrhizobium quebecense]UGY00498.1 EscU/YscU/HrcU family type III secretion system export apparatus switch protein [Bradyrhizobium quebecense]UPT87237.1 EscU/YscU/HrcU family t
MSGSSEEKKLPPTPKKLRDARKKGQSARSSDLVSGVSACAGFGCLWWRAGPIEDKWHETVRLIDKVQEQPFTSAVPQALSGLLELSLAAVAPLLACAVAAALLANILANGGFMFASEPLKPKLEKLDPVKGLKRIASKRSLIELGKTLVKVVVLGTSLFLTVMASWKTLVYLPVCGMGCLGFVFTEVKLLTGIAAAAFLVGGLADLLIQRWLFLQDMRMTETEAKRENKEQQGNPQIKREHRRLRQEAANEAPLGVHRATLILRGAATLIGLRYVRGETGVPILVCRGEGDAASQLLHEARALRLRIVDDDILAHQLLGKARLGNPVPTEYFEPVAKALYAAGLV